MIQIHKEENSLLLQQYSDNEHQTNRVVAYVSLIFVAFCIYAELSLKFDYSIGIHTINTYFFMPVSGLILIFFFIAWYNKYTGSWVKYMLMTGTVLMSVGSFFTYTTYMSYMVFLPVFISARYFNKNFMIEISVTTLLLFLASCVVNLMLEPKSEIMQLLHRNSGYNSWQNPTDAFTYIVMPMTLTFLFISAHSINETVNGRRLLESKAQSVVRTASVEAELNMASEIQKSVLPETSFTSPDGNFRISALEIPAKEVCGDFYDYFLINDHTLAVLIADVSDKGAPAAMFMMSAKKAIQCAVQCCNSLGKAIRLANTLICQDNKSNMFLTLWLGVIDTRSGVGKYINAGHLPPMIRHADGSLTSLENEPDIFIGCFPDMTPRVNVFRLRKDDILFIYTDGVTDASDSGGTRFESERLNAALKAAAPDADSITRTVYSAVSGFSGNAEQFDDMTMLALQCLSLDTPKSVSIATSADLNGTKTVIDGVDGLLEEMNCPDEVRHNAGVVCDEICANIANYAYGEGEGSFLVDVKTLSNYVTIRFTDSGEGFDPLTHSDPEFSDEPIIGGLGIFFVKNLTDEISYSRRDDKNILTVTLIWNI